MVAVQSQAVDDLQQTLLSDLIKESRKFLTEYDSVVLHKELYRSLFLHALSYLRGMLVELLQKFSTLPKEDFEDKVIECCGIYFKKRIHFKQHYDQVHNKKTIQSASLCELKMSLTRITFFERELRAFLLAGEISSCEMIIILKKILKRIDATLEF
ncbi:uncharacterized protein LOC129776820 [Toxorhynchites rutilus septentrionalis]|uniref:uncharacterized protein LOC129776820 n=1 Tax=Toxorhynchites rutilus septentrionalis TaxID=329112 RepID=UPI00247A86E3|nr:uncharacterized protein LOC129776820 [Toxorhynchites rutilus septentrionalis]XP_055638664.1 uncharacterized protein LOC129776820 [Toxorhynchites rutilus septentrionalis]